VPICKRSAGDVPYDFGTNVPRVNDKPGSQKLGSSEDKSQPQPSYDLLGDDLLSDDLLSENFDQLMAKIVR
jgi:hypothetical protein